MNLPARAISGCSRIAGGSPDLLGKRPDARLEELGRRVLRIVVVIDAFEPGPVFLKLLIADDRSKVSYSWTITQGSEIVSSQSAEFGL